MRTEQQEEKRKERKEQLDALKNPTRPQMLRQTLQRVLLFTSGVRASSYTQQKKKLPRRVRSLIDVPKDKLYVRKYGSLGSPSPMPVLKLRRLHNERRSEGDIEPLREAPVRKRSASLIPNRGSESFESDGGSDVARPTQLAITNPITKFNLDSPLETENDTEQFRRRKLSSVVSYQSTDRHEDNEQSIPSPSSNEDHQENEREETTETEERNNERSGSLDLATCRQSSIQSAPNGVSTSQIQQHSHSFERTQSLPQFDASKLRRPFLTRQNSLDISPGNETKLTEATYSSNHQK